MRVGELDVRPNVNPFGTRQHVHTRVVTFQSRSTDGEPVTVVRHDWNNANVALVICDMWNTTQCVSAARRVVDMACAR